MGHSLPVHQRPKVSGLEVSARKLARGVIRGDHRVILSDPWSCPMRGLVQRVSSASVTSNGAPCGQIGPGIVLLVGVTHDDDEAAATRLAEKVWHLRIMADDDGVMNLSVADTGGEVLVVSQFTLYGDTRRGRRPSWVDAARPDHAEPLVDAVAARLRDLGATVATGVFRTDMQVTLTNDGPVTLMLDV